MQVGKKNVGPSIRPSAGSNTINSSEKVSLGLIKNNYQKKDSNDCANIGDDPDEFPEGSLSQDPLHKVPV